METTRTFLQDLALVFCVATIVTILFQRLRQPVVLGYLLAGLIIGPHVPIPLFVDEHRIELLSELGVILVVFSIGLEFRLEKLVRVLPTCGIAGAVQVPAMLWLGSTIALAAGWNSRESLFLGGALCISSTMIVARVLSSHKQDARVRDNVFGILIVQDLAAILLISIFTAIAGGVGMPAGKVAWLVGELILFLVVAVLAGTLVVPRLVREAYRKGNSEVLLLAAIGVCFGSALAARHFGYSVALGAFIGGSLIAESGHKKKVIQLMEPVRDLFAALFFVSIGMLVDPYALAENWRMILIVSATVLLGQTIMISIGSFLSGHSIGVSVQTGMTLSQLGEFSFIIIGVGVGAGAIPDRIMAIIVGVAVITMFFTPFMVSSSQRVASGVERILPRPLQTFAALYGAWLESLRAPKKRSNAYLRRNLLLLFLDVVAIAGLVVAMALGRNWIAHKLAETLHVSVRTGGLLAMIAVLVLAIPFVIGLAVTVRRVGRDLAVAVLPFAHTGVDLGDAPRRAFVVALQLTVALAAIVPLVALTQPFLPLYIGILVLVALLGALGFVFWRSASNLHGHLRAGAELILEVLDKQRQPDLGERAQPTIPLTDLLPGLGSLVSVEIKPGSNLVGATLADINLRALTGATVVAIQRAGGKSVGTPNGEEILSSGDVLMLTGSTPCIDRAIELLST